MSQRCLAALFLLAFLSGAAFGQQPVRWGYAVTSSTGELLGSQSGLTGWQADFALLPTPVLPTGPATRDDPSWFPDIHVKWATTRATLTLTDEVTNFSQSLELFWTLKESWKLLSQPDGTWTAEVQDGWSESGPGSAASVRQVGSLRFQIEQLDQLTVLTVEPAGVPEPTTLVLGAIGLTGLVGARLRKRSR